MTTSTTPEGNKLFHQQGKLMTGFLHVRALSQAHRNSSSFPTAPSRSPQSFPTRPNGNQLKPSATRLDKQTPPNAKSHVEAFFPARTLIWISPLWSCQLPWHLQKFIIAETSIHLSRSFSEFHGWFKAYRRNDRHLGNVIIWNAKKSNPPGLS